MRRNPKTIKLSFLTRKKGRIKQSVKELSRQHHPNGKFLPSDEEGNYPPSLSLKISKRSCVYLMLNHSALGVIRKGV